MSALHLAAHNGKAECAELLLSFGANVDIKDKLGDTPLHKCIANGHHQCAKILLEHGASPTIQNLGKIAQRSSSDK